MNAEQAAQQLAAATGLAADQVAELVDALGTEPEPYARLDPATGRLVWAEDWAERAKEDQRCRRPE